MTRLSRPRARKSRSEDDPAPPRYRYQHPRLSGLKPDGLERTVLLLAISKPAKLYVTEAILAEYREVLARPEDDDKFLECADTAHADYLVTGNPRHFPKFWKNTKVITSREFISIVAPHLIS